jgi:hypothetical protein
MVKPQFGVLHFFLFRLCTYANLGFLECSFQRSIFRSSCFIMTTLLINGVNSSGIIVSFMSRAPANPNGISITYSYLFEYVRSRFWGLILKVILHKSLSKHYLLMVFSIIYRWFAKRFLHPDMVTPYEYIFVWDEDLGVENFDPMK